MEKKRILVVENDEITAYNLQASLRSLGYVSAGIFKTGEEAVEAIDENPPDLVLMDIHLSGDIDGIQAADYIIEKQSVPVIYLTSNRDLQTFSRTKDTHPYGYLLKPSSDRYIYIAIEMALSRFELEQNLRNHKNLFSHTIDSISDAVIAVDTTNTIMVFNRLAEQLTGFTSAEVLGKSLDAVYTSLETENGNLAENPCALVLKTNREIKQRESLLLQYKTGARFWISESCTLLKDSVGSTIGAVLIIHDISVRKQAEKERIKGSRIESMSLLAAGLAHDFNNILTGIVGNISMLKHLSLNQNDETKELISEIDKASLRARELANQIREFTKGGPPIKRNTDLYHLIHDTSSFILSGSNIDLTMQSDNNLPFSKTDPSQISQVIENIILNAKQALESSQTNKARININLDIYQVESINPMNLKEGDYIRITIADNGPGIVEENLERIFEPYFSTKSNGAGLGLATSYNNVKKNGGTIIAESIAGKGASFYIFLPSANTYYDISKTEDSLKPGSGTILILDDESSVRLTLQKILENLGYTVHSFSNSFEAIEFANNSDDLITAVFIDLTVPGSDSAKDTSFTLKQNNRALKTILMTGYSIEHEDVRNFQKNGFDSVLEKPFTIESVSSLLDKIILEQ
jgi:two-component system cell cycle sensor histidine kinase/response regulator CckA